MSRTIFKGTESDQNTPVIRRIDPYAVPKVIHAWLLTTSRDCDTCDRIVYRLKKG
jgi:hypothetical protein